LLEKTHYSSELKGQIGKNVVVAGWVHDVRVLGGINFLLLRDSEGIVQVTAQKEKVPKKILEAFGKIRQEDVLAVKGKVVKSKIAKAGIEIVPSEIEIISKSEVPLPLDPRGVTPANLDTCLNWRFMYFRTEEAKAIFKIQSEIVVAFRDFFVKNNFMEMQPPVIIKSASEGGAELFALLYFDKKAFLAQSPQLYKQMGAISFGKVFMVVPVFRAEKFDQPTHLNELRQLDFEQAFSDDEDAMQTAEKCLVHILQHVNGKCEKELKFLKRKLEIPKLPLKRITYTEAVELLKKRGEKISWGEDFSKSQEKLLAECLGEEAFFIKDWPTEIKAFYSTPHENDPKICRAYDLICSGLEICSGTQRIHMPELLAKQLKSKKLNPEDFKFYIDCFKYGSPPHAGGSFGLERITMSITGKNNIREVTMFPRDRNRIAP